MNDNHAKEQAAAQYASIETMLRAADPDTWERLEELREQVRPYTVGWNMLGYMLECEPAAFETFSDACEYLADEMMREAQEIEANWRAGAHDATQLFEAAAQYASIATMLRAADPATWEWLEELQDMEQEDMTDDEKSELIDLLDATSEYEDADAAREAIEQDALSVEYRSDWCSPGEEMTPAEFRILLCWGGPAVRIRGEMDEHGEPTRAWLEYQDWGTPWTQYLDANQDVLLAYARYYVIGG